MKKRRKVTISVCLPVTVTAYVKWDDNEEHWEISSIDDLYCSASARGVMEQMGDDEYEALDKAAEKAEEVES